MTKSPELGTCSATGYQCPTVTKDDEVIEVCYSGEKGDTPSSAQSSE